MNEDCSGMVQRTRLTVEGVDLASKHLHYNPCAGQTCPFHGGATLKFTGSLANMLVPDIKAHLQRSCPCLNRSELEIHNNAVGSQMQLNTKWPRRSANAPPSPIKWLSQAITVAWLACKHPDFIALPHTIQIFFEMYWTHVTHVSSHAYSIWYGTRLWP